jgi:aspartyl-tRNA(Asn)/glutamyl-tRNA(Gln) amidotransferase subunit B
VVQETRHWDEDGGVTISGRSKEEAHDYRYFPEPDLVPVAPTAEMRARVHASMPELPAARRDRLMEAWGIRDEDARVLVDVPGLADYAERAVAALKAGAPKDVANWVRQEVLAYVNENGLSPSILTPEMLAELVDLLAEGAISRGQAKDVLSESMAQDKWPREIVKERGLAQVSDAGELGAAVDRVLAANPDAVSEYRASEDDKARKKKRGFLMGQVMSELKGQANAQVLSQLLDDRLS